MVSKNQKMSRLGKCTVEGTKRGNVQWKAQRERVTGGGGEWWRGL